MASFAEVRRRRTSWGENEARVSAGCHSPKRRITHILGAERGSENIRRVSFTEQKYDAHPVGRGCESISRAPFSEEKRQRTSWGRQEHRQGAIWRREETTYILGAEWDGESVSRASFEEEKRQGTCLMWNGATRA